MPISNVCMFVFTHSRGYDSDDVRLRMRLRQLYVSYAICSVECLGGRIGGPRPLITPFGQRPSVELVIEYTPGG